MAKGDFLKEYWAYVKAHPEVKISMKEFKARMALGDKKE